jgi:hypothetical protein
MVRQAEYFADRLRAISPGLEQEVEAAWRLALGRLPSVQEKTMLAGYVRKHDLANACRLLFNLNEFCFID